MSIRTFISVSESDFRQMTTGLRSQVADTPSGTSLEFFQNGRLVALHESVCGQDEAFYVAPAITATIH